MAKTATKSKRRSKPTAEKSNKSAAIRAYLEAHPGTKPKAVVEALSGQGLQISPNLVSIIKTKMGTKRPKHRGSAQGGSNLVGTNRIQEVVAFVRVCGGMDQAKKALLNAEQLADLLR